MHFLMLCCVSGKVCGFLVKFSLRMGERDGVCSVRSLNEMNASDSTPVADTIKWAWLDTLYLAHLVP